MLAERFQGEFQHFIDGMIPSGAERLIDDTFLVGCELNFHAPRVGTGGADVNVSHTALSSLDLRLCSCPEFENPILVLQTRALWL